LQKSQATNAGSYFQLSIFQSEVFNNGSNFHRIFSWPIFAAKPWTLRFQPMDGKSKQGCEGKTHFQFL
jgi:hypothetical protein